MAEGATIPVVDFEALSLENHQIPSDSDEKVQDLAFQIGEAFEKIGFVYLKNYGISNEEIKSVRAVADAFFALPVEEKQKYGRPTDGTSNHGWVAVGQESLNPERPADLKEAFNVTEIESSSDKWPMSEVPEMQSVMKRFHQICVKLSLRILKLIGIALKIQNSDLIAKAHSRIGTPDNSTTVRLLYYPPIPDTLVIKKDQIRCGEHSDYGSVTLLFQDDLGGLQVLPAHGKGYIDAPTIPGCVIVNIGDLMQRWTADAWKSTKHRVVIPANELIRNKPRRSLACFVHPDDTAVVECLDGSNKYPPITGQGYLKQRFAATYGY